MSSAIRLNNQVNTNANQTFTATSTVQTFTVPAGVFWIRFFLWGAGGIGQNGGINVNSAGGGAFVEGNLRTAPGTVYYIVVGARGRYNITPAIANGGAAGGGTGADGGGFSGIFSSTPSASSVIAIAGGGGGAGFNGNGYGGGGGFPSGGTAQGSSPGGSQSAGGSGSFPGSQLLGGNAGFGGDCCGGGGGGGWDGGGGGNNSQGGGGGSSTVTSIVINPILENGTNGSPTGVAPTPPGGRNSPVWRSPLGSAGQTGFVVIGFNTNTSSLPIQITVAPPTFSPTSIPGCSLWLDGADSSSASMTLSGSTITNWKDKSGNGVTLTIGGTPTLSNAAYNSLSSVYFNGSANFYNTSFSLNLVNHSFFIVTYQPTGGNVGVLVFHITGTGTDDVYSPNALQFASPEFGVQGSYGAQPYSNLTYGIYGDVATPSNNSLILYKNGTSVITKTNLASRSSTGIAIGSRVYSGGYTYFMTGYVSEVIVYNTALTDIQRKSIEGYLGWKWGIQANLPAGHPYLTYSPKSGVGAGTSPLQITLGNVLSSTATAFITDNTTYTIPPKTSKIRIFVWGGGGNGNNYGSSGCGGSGAHVQGDFTVGSITSLTIYLNRGAGAGHFGNNGAGYGAVYNATTGYLLIAGGGGGSGSGYGGGGGYLQGFSGGSPSIAGQVSVQSTAAVGSGGGGGSQTQGGAGALSATAGSYLQGGSGEMSAYPSGGGGGYYGGGGGNGNGGTGRSGNGPGGGGSSYINMGYIKNYMGFDGQSGSTSSVLPGGSSSPYYVPGYGVGGRLTNGGSALVVIVPYIS